MLGSRADTGPGAGPCLAPAGLGACCPLGPRTPVSRHLAGQVCAVKPPLHAGAQGHHRSGDKEGHRGCTLPLPWYCSWSLGMAEPGRPPPGPEVPHKNPPGPGVTAGHRLGSGSAGLLHSSDYSQTRGSKDSSPLLDYILAGGTALPQPQGLGRGLWGQPLWSAEPN